MHSKSRDKLKFHSKKKLPIILQSEVSECGLASVLMVSCFYGREMDLTTARRKYNISGKGLTLEHLIDLSEKLGLQSRGLRCELEVLQQFTRPVILHWDLDHYVVLKGIRGNKATIHDPARGKITLDMDEVSLHFTGIVLELFPSADFVQCSEVDKVKLSDFWSKIHGLKGILVQILLLSAFLQLFVLASPLIQQMVIDDAVTMKDSDILTVIALGLLMFGIFQALIGYVRSKVILYLTKTLSFEMTSNLFRHLLRLPADYFEKRRLGDITTRFGSLTPIQSIITGGVVSAILDGLLAITTLMMAMYYSFTMTLILMGFIALGFVIQYLAYPYQKRQEEKIIELSGKEQTAFIENIQAAITIKIFGQESNRETLWMNKRADKMNASIELANFGMNLGLFTSILGACQQSFVLFMSAMLVINNEMTLGMLFAYQSYSGQFSSKVQGLIAQFFSFKLLDMHLDRLSDIVCEKSEQEPGKEQGHTDSNVISVKAPSGNIRLENIGFQYGENEETVLKDVNLSINKGEMLSITGRSGAGKSTLLKLLLGLVKPTSGKILINNTQIKDNEWHLVRKHVGVVMQDDKLLSGTIADNIGFFDKNCDENLIHECARKCHIHQEILDMPMGYNTLIGDMGSALSQGQKQRILLARALYKKPKILFLDEGTANLDEKTEMLVTETIRNMDITRIIIAHRPALIRASDRVLELRDKQIFDITRFILPGETA